MLMPLNEIVKTRPIRPANISWQHEIVEGLRKPSKEHPFPIPVPSKPVSRQVVFCPGSTIGTFHPTDAVAFLRRIRDACGRESALLIGVDPKKDRRILHAAYNDRAGVTAEFNLNILRRLNRELGSDFDPPKFKHEAKFNDELSRIEMHLVSRCEQRVQLNGNMVRFAEGETIWTESSYKYSLPEFGRTAAQAGYQLSRVWTNENDLFSLQYLTPASEVSCVPPITAAEGRTRFEGA